jgi:hypothetical protein
MRRDCTLHAPQRAALGVAAAALLVSLLVAVSAPSPSAADEVSVETTWATTCPAFPFEYVGPALPFRTTAPAGVVDGQAFEVEVAPLEALIDPTAIGGITTNVQSVVDLTYRYQVTLNASVESVGLIPGTGHGYLGDPTATIEHDGGTTRIAVHVPEVPADTDGPVAVQLPALTVTLLAGGPQGSVILPQLPSALQGGYALEYTVVAKGGGPGQGKGHVQCRADLSEGTDDGFARIPITSGPAELVTHTSLTTTETVVVDRGRGVRAVAWVDAVGGIVEFRDGSRLVGSAEVDADGYAVAHPAFIDAGAHQLTAHFLGAHGYAPSSSDPVEIAVGARAATGTFFHLEPTNPVAGQLATIVVEVETWGHPNGPNGSINVTIAGAAAGRYDLDDDGLARVPWQVWGAADWEITVDYLGDADHAPSTDTQVLSTTPARSDFWDVPANAPLRPSIHWLAGNGYAKGYPNGAFDPHADLTRQAGAVFLHRLLAGPIPTVPCQDAPFTDVPVDHPFCEEIAALASTGLLTGYSDGTFGPDRPLSRQAIAAILHRASGWPATPNCWRSWFRDVDSDHPYCGEIAWMAANAITTGFADGTFRPSDTVSREAMAAFLERWSNQPLPRGAV